MGNLHSVRSLDKKKLDSNSSGAEAQKWTALNLNDLFFDESHLTSFYFKEYCNNSQLTASQKQEIESLLEKHQTASESNARESDVELVTGVHSSVHLSSEHPLSATQQRLLLKHWNSNTLAAANRRTKGSVEEAFQESLEKKLLVLQNLNVVAQNVKPTTTAEPQSGEPVPESDYNRFPNDTQVSFRTLFAFILQIIKSVSRIDIQLAGDVINSLTGLLAEYPILSLQQADHLNNELTKPLNPTILKGVNAIVEWLVTLLKTTTDGEARGKIACALIQVSLATGCLSDVMQIIGLLMDTEKDITFDAAKPLVVDALEKLFEFDIVRPISRILKEPKQIDCVTVTMPEEITESNTSEGYAIAPYGNFVYVLKGSTLLKIGTGLNGTRSDHVYEHKPLAGCEYSSDDEHTKGCLAVAGNKLYYLGRTQTSYTTESITLRVYDANTIEPLEQELTIAVANINRGYKPEPDVVDNLKIIWYLLSDERSLYLLSAVAEKDNTLTLSKIDLSQANPVQPKNVRIFEKDSLRVGGISSFNERFPMTNGSHFVIRCPAQIRSSDMAPRCFTFSLKTRELENESDINSPEFICDSMSYDPTNNIIWGYKATTSKLYKWHSIGVPAPRTDQYAITLANGLKVPTLREVDRKLLADVFESYSADTPMSSEYIAMAILSRVNCIAWYFQHSAEGTPVVCEDEDDEITTMRFFEPLSIELSVETVSTICSLAQRSIAAITADTVAGKAKTSKNVVIALWALRILRAHIVQFEKRAKLLGLTTALTAADEAPLKKSIQDILISVIRLNAPSPSLVAPFEELKSEAISAIEVGFSFLYPEPTELMLKLISEKRNSEADSILLGIILSKLSNKPDLLSVFNIRDGQDPTKILEMLKEIVKNAVQSTSMDALISKDNSNQTSNSIVTLDFLTTVQRQLFHACYLLANQPAGAKPVTESTVVCVAIEYAKSLVTITVNELSKLCAKTEIIAETNMTTMLRSTICTLLINCLHSVCLLPKALLAVFGRSLLMPLSKLLAMVRTLLQHSTEQHSYETTVIAPVTKTCESIHPYENNMDVTNVVKLEGAKQLTVRFDPASKTEASYDKLYLYNSEDKSVLVHGPLSGSSFHESSYTIDGDTVVFHFTSDGSNVEWGWKAIIEAELKMQTTFLSTLKSFEMMILWLSTRWVSGFFSVRSDSEAEGAAMDKLTNYLDSEIFRAGLITDDEVDTKCTAFLDSIVEADNDAASQFIQLIQMHVPHRVYGYNSVPPAAQRAQRAVFAAILKQSGLAATAMDIVADMSTALSHPHWNDIKAIWNASAKVSMWIVQQTQLRLDEKLKSSQDELASLGSDEKSEREIEIKSMLMASIAGDIIEKALFVIKSVNTDAALTVEAIPKPSNEIATPIAATTEDPQKRSGPAFGRSAIANKWKAAVTKLTKFTDFFSVYRNVRQKQINRRNLARTLSAKVITFIQDDAVTVSELKKRIEERHVVAQHRLEEYNLVNLLLESSTSTVTSTNILHAFYTALLNTKKQEASNDGNDEENDGNDSETETNILAKHYLVDLKAINVSVRNQLVGAFTHLLCRTLSYLTLEDDSEETLKLKLQALRCWCIEFTTFDQEFIVQSGVLEALLHIINAPSSANVQEELRTAAWNVFRIVLLQCLGLGALHRATVTSEATSHEQQQQFDTPASAKKIIDLLFTQLKLVIDKSTEDQIYQLLLLILSITSARSGEIVRRYIAQTKWVMLLCQFAFGLIPKTASAKEESTEATEANSHMITNSRIVVLRLLRVLLAQLKPESFSVVVPLLGYSTETHPTLIDVLIEKIGAFIESEIQARQQQATESVICTEMILLLRTLLPSWHSELSSKLVASLSLLRSSEPLSTEQLQQVLAALSVLGGHIEKAKDIGAHVAWTPESAEKSTSGVVVQVLEDSKLLVSEDGPLARNEPRTVKIDTESTLVAAIERANVDPTLVQLSPEVLTSLVNTFQNPASVLPIGSEVAKLRIQANIVKALCNILLSKQSADQTYQGKLLPALLKTLIQYSHETSSLQLLSETLIHKQLSILSQAITTAKKESESAGIVVRALLACAPTCYRILGDDLDPESSIHEQLNTIGASRPASISSTLVSSVFEMSDTSSLEPHEMPYEYEGEAMATLVYQLNSALPTYLYYATVKQGSRVIIYASENYPNLSRISQSPYDTMTPDEFREFIWTKDAKTLKSDEPIAIIGRKDNNVTYRFKIPIAARYVIVRVLNSNFSETDAKNCDHIIEMYGWNELPTMVAENNVFVNFVDRPSATPLTLETTCIDGEPKNWLKKSRINAKLIDWTALLDVEVARQALTKPAIVIVDATSDEVAIDTVLKVVHSANDIVGGDRVQAIVLLADSMGKVNNIGSNIVPEDFKIPIFGSASKEASIAFYESFLELCSLTDAEIKRSSTAIGHTLNANNNITEAAVMKIASQLDADQSDADKAKIKDISERANGNVDEAAFTAFQSFYDSNRHSPVASTLTCFTNTKWSDMTTESPQSGTSDNTGSDDIATLSSLLTEEQLMAQSESERELLAINLYKMLIVHLLTKLSLTVLSDVLSHTAEIDAERFCTISDFVTLIKIALVMTAANSTSPENRLFYSEKPNELIYTVLTRLLTTSSQKEEVSALLVSNALGRIVNATLQSNNTTLAAGAPQGWWILDMLIDIKSRAVYTAETLNVVVTALSNQTGIQKQPIVATLRRILTTMPMVLGEEKPSDSKLIRELVRLYVACTQALKSELGGEISQSHTAYIELYLATRRILDLWLTADEQAEIIASLQARKTETKRASGTTKKPIADKEGRIPADLRIIMMEPEHGSTSRVVPGSWRIRSGHNFPSFKIDAVARRGKLYYEVKLIVSDYIQFGWARTTFQPNGPGGRGVGDTEDSWSYDGGRRVKFHGSSESYGQTWTAGQLVGCMIDLDEKTISFSLDGTDLGVAYSGFEVGDGIYPVISMTRDNDIFVNVGQRPFVHMPAGYTPVLYYKYTEQQPSKSDSDTSDQSSEPEASTSTSAETSTAPKETTPFETCTTLELYSRVDQLLLSIITRKPLPQWFIDTIPFSQLSHLSEAEIAKLTEDKKWDNPSWTVALDSVIVDRVNKFVATNSDGNNDDPNLIFTTDLDFGNVTIHADEVKARYLVLNALNDIVMSVIKVVDFALDEPENVEQPIVLSFTQKVLVLRPLVWKHKKDEVFARCLSETCKDNAKPTVILSRMRAIKTRQRTQHEFESNGSTPNSIGEEDDPLWFDTMFGQLFRYIHDRPADEFRGTDRTWTVKFAGEGATDAGGPFRESFEMCAEELTTQYCSLPLFIPTPNAHSKIGVNRDKFIPRPTATTQTCLEMFKFVGKLMGMALRTRNLLQLDLAPIVWKMLVGQTITRRDLVDIDQLGMQTLDMLIDKDGNLNADNFQYAISEMNFTINSSDYTILGELELKPSGKNLPVTYENRLEYVALAEKFKRSEFVKQVNAIRAGLATIIPVNALKTYTWSELELKVCGANVIDIDMLKKFTTYSSCYETDRHVQLFWEVIQSFSPEERAEFVRFVWGRSTIPVTVSDWGSDRFKIQEHSKSNGRNPDHYLPEAHTCFFSFDLPRYTSAAVMRSKILYAQKFCTSIDTDFVAQDLME